MAIPSNENVLKDREKYIGGSEISTILGINKFQTRFNLLMIKAGWEQPMPVNNPYVDFGTNMEKFIRYYINDEYGHNFAEDTIAFEDELIGQRCNYDGLEKGMNLEIKTTSQIHENVRDYKYYIVQLLFGMILADIQKGILAVYRRNEDLNIKFEPERLQVFEINRKDYSDWEEEIVRGIIKFKEDLLKVKADMNITEYDLQEQLPVEVNNKIQSIIVAHNKYLEAKKIVDEYDAAKKDLFILMEKNNIKRWDTEKGLKFTLVESKNDETTIVEEFDLEKFKVEHPKTYKKYISQKEKVIKGKKGYVKVC